MLDELKAADGISIHAAREGGDLFCFIVIPLSVFQSTPPVKAANGPLRS